MTPISAPGAAAIPPAATPRAQGPPAAAGVPRPMRGSYGNLGAAVRVAPSPTPRAHAPPTAPGIPIARPRVPLAPHKQGGPAPGAPRPMVNHGGAPMSAATPTPRMQAPPQPGRAPGIPPNTCGVGARPHTPLVQPTQRTPAVTAPSLGKREPTTMGPAPIQQAKRHAPMPRPQGAPTGGAPLPTNVRAPVPPGHAPTAGNTTPPRPPSPPQLPMFGVFQDPSKGWMARVVDPRRRAARDIGPFDTVHLAALAHDRVAVAYAGRGMGPRARLNFETAFYAVETAFLQRWEGDVCEAVEKGEYEKTYAKFLKAGYKAALNVKPADGGGDEGGEKVSDDGDEGDELMASCYDAELFWETIEDFFLNRPVEIGAMALGEGGELLRNRFVEMHRNKSLCPVWRRGDRMEKLKTMALQKQQQQQQQQQQIQIQQQQQQQRQIQTHQQQQIQMQPQQHQQQIQMQRQQQVRQQQMMMIQKQRQQQMMMAQQQQQYPDDDARLQVKQEI